MKQKLLNKLWLRVGMIVAIMTTALSGTVKADEVTDVLTAASFAATSTTYTNFSGVSFTSDAVYAGNSAKTSNGGIQLRSKNSNSGIVSTTSGGKVKSVSITVESGSNTVDVYGSNTAYTAASDLYGNNQGTKLGSLSANSTTVTVEGDYAYVGIRSNNGAIYLTNITIVWEVAGGSTPTCATPTFSPAAGAVVSGTEVTITSTDGATIYYTTNGQNPTTSSNVYSDPIEITTGTTIKAYAVKDGFEDSEVATASYTIKQAVSGYTIDFENDVDDYVDWTFTNAEQAANGANVNINAHGGTHYGTTGGKATASIQTKTTLALPGTFTCYVSRQSTNSTSSTWYIQVSDDGSTWTNVESKSATSMNAGTWEEFTANLEGYSDVYVRLYYSGSTAVRNVDDISIIMRDPNAKKTPVVTIDATGITTTDIAGNANVAAGTLAATVTSGETTINTPAVTWSSSDTDVATVNATTGAVTLIGVGTATITASFAGNDDYTEASATYELTVIDSYAKGQLNNPYTVAEAIAAYDAAGANIAGVYVTGIVCTASSQLYSNKYLSYYISDDGTTNSSQLEAYNGLGLNGANFTSVDDVKVGDVVVIYGTLTYYANGSKYEMAANNHLVSLEREKQDPTIVLNSTETVAYGSTFTIDDTMIEGGDITVTSGNVAVATVEGLVITPVAVGTTTITVTTAENTYYNAGSGTFELTVTAPVGGTTAPTGSAGGTIFEETFAKCDGTGGNDGSWSGSIATNGLNDNVTDESGWTFVQGNGANGCAKFGSGSKGGSATTPALGHAGTLTLTFKAAAWNGSSEGTTLSLSAANATLRDADDEEDVSEVTMEKGAWTSYTLIVKDAAANATITFSTSSGNHRFFLDDVKVVAPATPAPEIKATLNGSGYATFCSEYPLDFSEVTDFSAWQITDISSSNKITFEQVTGSVKGGTGLFLKGEAGATVTIPSADSSNELTGNLLVGTLAPSYFTANQIYGLAGDTFKKNSAGSIRANRAYIPADYITVSGSGVKPFTFIFEDDATGISLMEDGRSQMEDGVIYNLAGQRLDNSQFTIHNSQLKRGIYIVNGKKILK